VRGVSPVHRERRRWSPGRPDGPAALSGRHRPGRPPVRSRSASVLHAPGRGQAAAGEWTNESERVHRETGRSRSHGTRSRPPKPSLSGTAWLRSVSSRARGPASLFVLFDESTPHAAHRAAGGLPRADRGVPAHDRLSEPLGFRAGACALKPALNLFDAGGHVNGARPDPGFMPSAPPAPVTPDSTQRGAAPTPSRAGPAAPARAARVVRADLDAARPERSSPACAWIPIGSLTSHPARPTRGRPRCGGGVEK
jgi:hypothetical protein